jgi:hypothetical protein
MTAKKHAYLHVQMSFPELKAFRKAARNKGITVSEYIRALANKLMEEGK